MTAFEKIETGMHLMAKGCKEARSCSNCPYEKLCEKNAFLLVAGFYF
jgi:hypothetical protein